MRSFFPIFLLLLAGTATIQAQQVQASFMSGPTKTDFQTFLVQPLKEESRFTFISLAFFQRYHRADDQPFDELGVQGILYWNPSRLISIGPGLYYNFPKGLMPKLSMQVFKRIGTLTVVLNPAFYYHEDNFTGAELYSKLIWLKPLNEQFSLFAGFSSLTTWDRLEDHGRSFIQLRLGPAFSSNLKMGLAFDMDWYGPAEISRQSVGVFVEQEF